MPKSPICPLSIYLSYILRSTIIIILHQNKNCQIQNKIIKYIYTISASFVVS